MGIFRTKIRFDSQCGHDETVDQKCVVTDQYNGFLFEHANQLGLGERGERDENVAVGGDVGPVRSGFEEGSER